MYLALRWLNGTLLPLEKDWLHGKLMAGEGWVTARNG
jgi:hypothetical protein